MFLLLKDWDLSVFERGGLFFIFCFKEKYLGDFLKVFFSGWMFNFINSWFNILIELIDLVKIYEDFIFNLDII